MVCEVEYTTHGWVCARCGERRSDPIEAKKKECLGPKRKEILRPFEDWLALASQSRSRQMTVPKHLHLPCGCPRDLVGGGDNLRRHHGKWLHLGAGCLISVSITMPALARIPRRHGGCF